MRVPLPILFIIQFLFRKSLAFAVVWLSVWAVLPTNAFAVPLRMVTHLFDIEYGFSQPSDVAVSADGRIYVVDGVNNKVKVFRSDGNFDFSFGGQGSGKGEFLFPLGIYVGPSGSVYIADSGNHRIQIFDGSGRFRKEVRLPDGGGRKSDPTDVAVNEALNLCYVVDNDNHKVVVIDLKTFEPIDSFGVPGGEKRQFRYPFLIDIDSAGFVYVVDVVNTRVQVFNEQGHFVSIVGGWGVEKGMFFRPKGVAVAPDGLVYVSDSYMGVIQLFQANGWFSAVVGDAATGQVKKFKSPVGICIDKQNRLYVVEMFADRVGVYSIDQSTGKK